MSTPRFKRKAKPVVEKQPPSRFAPGAFLSASPEIAQALCDELANVAATRFKDLAGTTWDQVGTSLVEQLRASGHDLRNFDSGEGLQEWHASWHHPRGNFSLFLSFRAPSSVEVSWKTDDATYRSVQT